MGRKEYVAIADIIAKSETKEQIISRLADLFESDNPRFDQKKFINACKGDKNEQL